MLDNLVLAIPGTRSRNAQINARASYNVILVVGKNSLLGGHGGPWEL